MSSYSSQMFIPFPRVALFLQVRGDAINACRAINRRDTQNFKYQVVLGPDNDRARVLIPRQVEKHVVHQR